MMSNEQIYPGEVPGEEDYRLPEIALNSLDDAVLVCQLDSPYTITFSNAALSRIRGSRRRVTNAPFPRSHSPFPAPMDGPSFTRLFSAHPEKKSWESVMSDLRTTGKPFTCRLVLRPGDRADPNPVPVDVRMTPVHVQDGKPTQFIAVLRDIRPMLYAEKERAAIAKNLDCVIAELSNRALHDNMTGLPNRFYFRQKIDGNLSDADRRKNRVGFILIDLDNFKEVNDTLGHAMGDELLLKVVEAFRKLTLPNEYIVRWGGDEFLWIIPDLADEAAMLARFPAIIAAVAAVGRPDPSVSGVTASIGHSVYPDDGGSVDDLVSMADYAMYRVKGSGKNGWYRPADGSSGQPGENVPPAAIFRKISSALTSGGIFARYTPIVELATRRVRALECRLSWKDAELGEIRAEEFVPYVERKGQLAAFSYAMFDRALAELSPLLRERPDLYVGFDLPLSIITDRQLDVRLRETCARHDVPHASVMLRVTERKPFLRRGDFRVRLEALKAAGFRFSLAHYASGAMSNETFLQLPLDEVQVDEIIVRDTGSARADWILSGIVALNKKLGTQVVAAGVHERRQAEDLLKLGFELAKGDFFGRSLTLAELRELPGFSGR